MIAVIEKAILDTLKANSFGIANVDFKELISGQMNQYKLPAIRLTSRTGSPSKNMQEHKLTSVISVILITHTLKNKSESELMTMEFIYAIYKILTRNKLGLLLDEKTKAPVIRGGLIPGPYNDITQVGGTTDFQAAGYAVYEIQFMATFEIEQLPQPDQVDRGILKSIRTKYYGNDDSIAEIESLCDFTEIDGGNAYTELFDTIIDGGSAGTPELDYTEEIDGGKADTNYDC
jgi:hypothetical protein